MLRRLHGRGSAYVVPEASERAHDVPAAGTASSPRQRGSGVIGSGRIYRYMGVSENGAGVAEELRPWVERRWRTRGWTAGGAGFQRVSGGRPT